MSKPTIFISHISEESEIARIFKEEIETCFLGMVNTFVSSDASSLPLGKNWLSEIMNILPECTAMLIFCSPYSIGRPWINFECGAGWSSGIDIAPVCHSGLRPVDLPLPVSLLQGIEAADTQKMAAVFHLIADRIGSHKPKIDEQAIATKVRAFEKRYTEATQMTSQLESLRSISADIFNVFSKLSPEKNQRIEQVPERLIQAAVPHLDALKRQGHLDWNYGVTGTAFVGGGGSGGGNFGTLTVVISPQLAESFASLSDLEPDLKMKARKFSDL